MMTDRGQLQRLDRSPTYLYELSTIWSQSSIVDLHSNSEDHLQGLKKNLPRRESRQGEGISVRHSLDLRDLIAKPVLESSEGS